MVRIMHESGHSVDRIKKKSLLELLCVIAHYNLIWCFSIIICVLLCVWLPRNKNNRI